MKQAKERPLNSENNKKSNQLLNKKSKPPKSFFT